MREARFGVMTHFLHDWIMHEQRDQMTPENWNKLVDGFDVEAVADQLKAVGASYYLISIGQNSGYYLSPNAAYDRITGITPSKLSHRDLVADLAVALSKRGIKLMVYLPGGAPSGDAASRAALKWKNGPYRNAEFQRNWEAIIREWSLRWRDKVVGWWFDGVYWPNNMYRSLEPPNFRSFAAAARAGNPRSAVAFNPGQVNRTLSLTPYEDYIAGEIGDPNLWSARRNFDGLIDGAQIHFLSHLGATWGQGAPRFSTEQAITFSRAVAEVGGAVTWDTPAQRNGTFAPEFLAQLKAIGEGIRATAIKPDPAPDARPATPADGGPERNPSPEPAPADQQPASARGVARAEAPTPDSLPGRGIAQHDFICAGQWDTRNPLETATLVRGGEVVWTFTIPDKNERNETAEFSDIHLLSNGNLLYAHKTGAAEVTPDKKLVWSYIAPPGTEVHSAQPIGLDRVFLGQNGFPAKATKPRISRCRVRAATSGLTKQEDVMTNNPVSRRWFLERMSIGAALAVAPHWSRGAESPPQKKLGVALVGLGGYSTRQLGPALRETKFCRLAGVVTGSRPKGEQWARDYGFSQQSIYNYDSMARIADDRAIDIVYVVTPNGLHAEHAIAAAKAGKHVILEKPMCNTVAECDAVLAACKAANVRHSIGYRLFWDPYHTELRRLAREEDFGSFKKMKGDRGFVMDTWRWRADKKLAGGGPLMDLGIYLIQGACMAKNGVAPAFVTARELPKTRPDISRDTEETLEWAMEWPDGAVAEFTTSYQRNFDHFRAEAPKGWIDFEEHAFGYKVGTVETSRGPLHYPALDQQALQMDDFAQCLQTGRATPVPGEMGRRDLAIIEAIYRAAASGRREGVKAS